MEPQNCDGIKDCGLTDFYWNCGMIESKMIISIWKCGTLKCKPQVLKVFLRVHSFENRRIAKKF